MYDCSDAAWCRHLQNHLILDFFFDSCIKIIVSVMQENAITLGITDG